MLEPAITLRVADGRGLTILEAVPVVITTEKREIMQMHHIVSEFKSLFLSKQFMKDLGIMSKQFPQCKDGGCKYGDKGKMEMWQIVDALREHRFQIHQQNSYLNQQKET